MEIVQWERGNNFNIGILISKPFNWELTMKSDSGWEWTENKL